MTKKINFTFIMISSIAFLLIFFMVKFGIIQIKRMNKEMEKRTSYKSKIKRVKLYDINLKTEKEANGYFIIIVGGYKSETMNYYYFYADTKEGIKLFKFDIENVRFELNDNVEPYCEYKTEYKITTLQAIYKNNKIVKLVIPNNSIKRNYDINIK